MEMGQWGGLFQIQLPRSHARLHFCFGSIISSNHQQEFQPLLAMRPNPLGVTPKISDDEGFVEHQPIIRAIGRVKSCYITCNIYIYYIFLLSCRNCKQMFPFACSNSHRTHSIRGLLQRPSNLHLTFKVVAKHGIDPPLPSGCGGLMTTPHFWAPLPQSRPIFEF